MFSLCNITCFIFPLYYQPVVPRLQEVIRARSHDSVQFQWQPLGQHVHNLFLQCMLVKKGKGGFAAGFDASG